VRREPAVQQVRIYVARCAALLCESLFVDAQFFVVGKSEICDAELEPSTFSIPFLKDQNVTWLQVSMDNFVLVHGLEAGEQLSHNNSALLFADTLLIV